MPKASKIEQEQATVTKMVQLYCHKNHALSDRAELPNATGLCQDCAELLAYAQKRVQKCPHLRRPEARPQARQQGSSRRQGAQDGQQDGLQGSKPKVQASQPAKPVCSSCTIHCYAPAKRAQMRKVMRYAGPRMLLRHPLMTLRHVFAKRP